jgi:hypothetical protein
MRLPNPVSVRLDPGKQHSRVPQNPPDARNRRNPRVAAVSRGEPYGVRLFSVKPDGPILSLFPDAFDPDGRRLEP